MKKMKIINKKIEAEKRIKASRENALFKFKGEIVTVIDDFYNRFISMPPFNDNEYDAQMEIISLVGKFIDRVKMLESSKYEEERHMIGVGFSAVKEITEEDELLAIRGILSELEKLYQENIRVSACNMKRFLVKKKLIDYLLSEWLYEDGEKKRNCLNNYKNLYMIIATINRHGDELQLRDFDRMDCIYFYSILCEALKNDCVLDDEDILTIFVAFINKNIWRNELLSDMADDVDSPKEVIKGANPEKELYSLKKTNDSLAIIKNY